MTTSQTRVTRGPNPMLEWRYVLNNNMSILGSRYGWPALYWKGPTSETLTRIDDPSRFGDKPETKAKFLAFCRKFESTDA